MIRAVDESKANGLSAKHRRELLGRYHRQIRLRPADGPSRANDLLALTFRPGDRTATFGGTKFLRPLGAAVLVALSHEADDVRLSGLRCRLGPEGFGYGADGQREFQHTLSPSRGGRGVSLARNPSLFELMLRMDARCERDAPFPGRRAPQLPKIWLGFAPDAPPCFEHTPALVRTAAVRLGLPQHKLQSNPAVLVERLLRQTWESLLWRADDPSNPSGLVLIEAEYCKQVTRALRVFEDFRALLGARTRNPAGGLRIPQAKNPAAALIAAHGHEPRSGWENEAAPERLDSLLAEMREAVSKEDVAFTDDDLAAALAAPEEPLIAFSLIMPELRRRLDETSSECTAEADLHAAARRPHEPLTASGACRIQVVRCKQGGFYGPADFGRRITLDCRPIVWPSRRAAVA